MRSLVTEMFKTKNKLSPPFICYLIKGSKFRYQTRSYYNSTEQNKVYNGPQDIHLMKTNKQKIVIESTKNSLIRSYFLNYPLISKCEIL